MTDAPLVDSARIFALIPAAGVGRRMGADCPKQYMPIAGVPMLVRTVEALLAASRVERVFVVVSPEDSYIDHAAESFAKWGDRVKILRAGGAERADHHGRAICCRRTPFAGQPACRPKAGCWFMMRRAPVFDRVK